MSPCHCSAPRGLVSMTSPLLPPAPFGPSYGCVANKEARSKKAWAPVGVQGLQGQERAFCGAPEVRGVRARPARSASSWVQMATIPPAVLRLPLSPAPLSLSSPLVTSRQDGWSTDVGGEPIFLYPEGQPSRSRQSCPLPHHAHISSGTRPIGSNPTSVSLQLCDFRSVT